MVSYHMSTTTTLGIYNMNSWIKVLDEIFQDSTGNIYVLMSTYFSFLTMIYSYLHALFVKIWRTLHRSWSFQRKPSKLYYFIIISNEDYHAYVLTYQTTTSENRFWLWAKIDGGSCFTLSYFIFKDNAKFGFILYLLQVHL